jgi:hypothetical protein
MAGCIGHDVSYLYSLNLLLTAILEKTVDNICIAGPSVEATVSEHNQISSGLLRGWRLVPEMLAREADNPQVFLENPALML